MRGVHGGLLVTPQTLGSSMVDGRVRFHWLLIDCTFLWTWGGIVIVGLSLLSGRVWLYWLLIICTLLWTWEVGFVGSNLI